MLRKRESSTKLLCWDSTVLEGPARALSLLHLSQVECKWALTGTTGGSVTWSTGCVLWCEAIPNAGSKQLLWGLRIAAALHACFSWSVLWGPSVPLVVFRAAVWARQLSCSKALWLALCVQGRGAAGPAQGYSWLLAAPVSYSSPGLPSQHSWLSTTKP